MEVHHHPSVEKKNFKEYFLEFLMIFLAVTMGFFAESIREHITDNAKEKEYILSMIEDAQTDTASINAAIALNKLRALHLDSLGTLCINYSASSNDAEIYRLYRFGIVHPIFISPTERTMLQLKNAGGMRLIRKKAAVDSIIIYDDMAKKLIDQQTYYERYQNGTVDMGVQLFNFRKFGFSPAALHLKNGADKDSSIQLLDKSKTKLMEFGNRVIIYQGVVSFYVMRLQEMNEHAIHLIQSLRKEYDISE